MAKSPVNVPKSVLTPTEGQALEPLLAELHIVPDNRTVILVGDGSGSGWDTAGAWATVSIEWQTRERLVWYGYANRASVNFAEAMAYLQPLCWLINREIDRKEGGDDRRELRIHVITDSQYVADSINKRIGRTNGKNSPLWAAFNAIEQKRIFVRGHWAEREKADLNKYADHLSRFVRTSLKGWAPEGKHPEMLYQLNPDDTAGH